MDANPASRAGDREPAPGGAERLELRLWLRLLACAGLIERELRARLAREFRTTLPRFDALAQLDRAPGGLTMGELSARLMVSNGNVTGLVARLAREGLVAREADPRDRRGSRVRLTAEGRRAFASLAPAHARWIDAALRGLGRGDKAKLLALLGRLRETLRAPPPAPPPQAKPQ